MNQLITAFNHPSGERMKGRRNPTRSGWARYGFGVVVTSLVIALHFVISPYINRDAFDLFQGAVFLSAWYGGLRPALLTSLISIVALDYFFIPPLNAFAIGVTDLIRLAIFGAVAILTSSLSARLKQANSKLENAQAELENRIQQRTEELFQANKEILEISNREQRRLGQDVHDGLCQILVGVKLITEELKENLQALGLPQQENAALVESRLSEALAQADLISRGLYPIELESNGLMTGLQELATKISKIHSVHCRFICFWPVDIDDTAVATHVYRIAQEAVMNAIKSGKAKNINLRLIGRGSRVLLTIADDGIGFHKKPLRQGMGLKIMEYRTRMINGLLLFRSRPKGGTRVTCSFPI